jgi:hypothetical protein
MVNSVDHDTCLDKKFSIVFYIIQDSLGSKTVGNTAPMTNSIVTVLNNAFGRICVSFQKCSTVIIPMYPYNKWKYDITDTIMTNNYYTENTINFYLPGKVVTPGWEQNGYAHAPNVPGAVNSTKSVLVLGSDIDCPTTAFCPNDLGIWYSDILHIIGHFFGLADTFLEIGSPAAPAPPNPAILNYEFVRRINCATNGDGICDTDADPYNLSYYKNVVGPPKTWCAYDPGGAVVDGNGDFYTPPLDNFMSMYLCRCRFTQQQYNKMVGYILQNRMNLH